jgi:hypothetical protein
LVGTTTAYHAEYQSKFSKSYLTGDAEQRDEVVLEQEIIDNSGSVERGMVAPHQKRDLL